MPLWPRDLRPRARDPSRHWRRARVRSRKLSSRECQTGIRLTKIVSFQARSLTLRAVNVTTKADGDHQKFGSPALRWPPDRRSSKLKHMRFPKLLQFTAL